jgi:hypothetical protein
MSLGISSLSVKPGCPTCQRRRAVPFRFDSCALLTESLTNEGSIRPQGIYVLRAHAERAEYCRVVDRGKSRDATISARLLEHVTRYARAMFSVQPPLENLCRECFECTLRTDRAGLEPRSSPGLWTL